MAGARKKKGRSTSSSVTMSMPQKNGSLITTKADLRQIRADRLKGIEERETRLKELTSEARLKLAEARLEVGAGADYPSHDFDDINAPDFQQSGFDDDADADEEDDNQREIGHDGRAVDNAQRDAFKSYVHYIKPQKKRAKRSRLARNRAMYSEWEAQAPNLVAAYMQWKYGSRKVPSGDNGDAHTSSNPPAVHHFDVTVVDIKEHILLRKIPQAHNELANVSLIRAGLLGCSPVDPSVATTLDCLELYHQIRRRQSSFSLQAICKVLCALHNVTYYPTFRTQLSIAFDLYLDILRRVTQLVDQALSRDSADWRLRHACPSCSYEINDEPTLTPKRLQAMDGNFSLKRVEGSGHADERMFKSDYHILPSQVDLFKDDVRSKPGAAATPDPSTQPGTTQPTCTDNWNAAHAVSEETTQVFDQTGGFVSACRHGLIQTFVEMRKSGELAKYGIATLDKILTVFKDDQAVGCDIACAFTATVRDSSIGACARQHRLSMALNAFHGYAHGRACMLRCHPLYLSGFGLEDLETCERVFSASNAVARLVRHASYFHYLQFIDLHFQQWDDDKYLELSKFLYNNYKQALAIINDYTPELAAFKQAHGFEDADFLKWREEELEWLASRAKEPEEDVLTIAYVEALEKLQRANESWGRLSTVPWQGYTPTDLAPAGGSLTPKAQAQVNARESERRAALRKLDLALNVADDLEHRLGITKRWTVDDAKYGKTVEYIKQRTFVRAVETLEGLVVARLFELAKANLVGTCFKLRKNISKAITRRGAALHTALDKYNMLAAQQDPPRPRLEHADIAGYGWLANFELLKHSRRDIQGRPWALQANREVSIKHFKVIRAREEIVRLNVEIRRLQTWVNDEDTHLLKTARELESPAPLIAARVRELYSMRHRVNNVHRARLRAIYELHGYTGHHTAGVRVGTMDVVHSGDQAEPSADVADCEVAEDLEGQEEMEIIEDDVANEEAVRFGEYLEELSFQVPGYIH